MQGVVNLPVESAQDKALLSDLLAERRPHLADIFLSLPLPPSVNHMYVTVQFTKPDGSIGARRVASPVLLSFKEDVESRMRYLYRIEPGSWKHTAEIGCRGAILVTDWRSDLDNRLKAAIDVVTKFLGVNDNRVVETEVRKYVDKYTLPRILMQVYILKYASTKGARKVAGRKGLQYV